MISHYIQALGSDCRSSRKANSKQVFRINDCSLFLYWQSFPFCSLLVKSRMEKREENGQRRTCLLWS